MSFDWLPDTINWFLEVNGPLWIILGWALKLFRDKTGVEVDEQHKTALHAALGNGVRAALAFFKILPGQPVPVAKVTAFAASYALQYNAEDVKHFDLDTAALEKLASSHLPSVNPETAPTPEAMGPTPAGPIKTAAA
jgi:hypothetical protein